MGESTILMAVGDIMISENRGTGQMISRYGPEFPFRKINKYLQKADILFGNLENPISQQGKPFKKQNSHTTFRAQPSSINGLTSCHFDVLSLANNHANDYGTDALAETLDILSNHNIKCAGAGCNKSDASNPIILNKNGIKICFLAYSYFIMFSTKPASRSKPGINPFLKYRVKKDIRMASDKADIVIVSMHWGLDFTDYPVPLQMKHARELIDNGANLILGHHPHHIQGVEKYKNGIIAYSLGDFIFDEAGQDTVIFKCELTKHGINNYEMIPARVSDRYQTELLDPPNALQVINKIASLSRLYETYDPAIADKMTSDYIFINLYIFFKSYNFYALRNLISLSIAAKLIIVISKVLFNKFRRMLRIEFIHS